MDPSDRTAGTEAAGSRRKFRWAVALLIALGIGVGIVASGATTWMVNATSTNDFCATACHSMQWAAAGYERGPHYINDVGVRATCSDCHIPYEDRPATPFQYIFGTMWTKGIDGTHDVVARLRGVIEDKAKWEAARPRLNAEVETWFKHTGSVTCQGCHDITAFTSTTPAAAIHASLNKADKIDCVQCHTDVGHKFPESTAAKQ